MISLIIAAGDSSGAFETCLSRFVEELRGFPCEIVVVDASQNGLVSIAARRFPRVRILRRPAASLTPWLWRDGLQVTSAPLVAFTTSSMRPAEGWLSAMLRTLERTGAAGVGGGIEPSTALSPTDQAVFLLRYVQYLPPWPDPAALDPPGDNAVYVRERLAGLEPLIAKGFWETEIHRALRARGETLAMAEDAVVSFQGGSRLRSMLRQRHRHGRVFGASRRGRTSVAERLARTAAAPLISAVMLRRISRAMKLRRRSLAPWLASSPQLTLLLAAWVAGEARGHWDLAS